MGHENPSDSSLAQEGDRGHIHRLDAVGTAHENVPSRLGDIEGTGRGPDRPVDRL